MCVIDAARHPGASLPNLPNWRLNYGGILEQPSPIKTWFFRVFTSSPCLLINHSLYAMQQSYSLTSSGMKPNYSISSRSNMKQAKKFPWNQFLNFCFFLDSCKSHVGCNQKPAWRRQRTTLMLSFLPSSCIARQLTAPDNQCLVPYLILKGLRQQHPWP